MADSIEGFGVTVEGFSIELDDDDRDTAWYRKFMIVAKAERDRN